MPTGTVYLIENCVSGKCYVGQTTQRLHRRWHGHLNDARNGSDYPLHRAIRKYGVNAFTVSVLEQIDSNFLNDAEITWIKKLNSFENGYNLTLGGGGIRGWKHSDAARQKISARNSGKIRSREVRDMIRKSVYESFERNLTKDYISDATKLALANPIVRARMEANVYSKTRKRVQQLSFDDIVIATFKSASEASLMTGVNKGNLCACCRGCFEQAGGFKWRYVCDIELHHDDI